MAIFDKAHGGYRVFIGDLGSKVGKYELERELDYYGTVLDVWVARSPPGFAFVVYKYPEDAEKAVRDLHGRAICGRTVRVSHAVPYGTSIPKQSRDSKESYSNLCGRRVRAEHAVPYDSRRSRRGPPPRYYARYDSHRSRSRSRDRRSRSRDRRRRSRSRHRSYTRSRSRSRTRSRDRKRSRSSRSRSHEKSRSRRRTDSERSRSPARKSKTRSKSRDKNVKSRTRSPERKEDRQSVDKKQNGEDNTKQNGDVTAGE